MTPIRRFLKWLLVADRKSLGSLHYKRDGAPKAKPVDADAEIELGVKTLTKRREEATEALKRKGTWLGIDGVGLRHVRRAAREEEARLAAQKKKGTANVVSINRV